ncbi:MAG TPA: hypothetical protein VGG24_14630 [Paraburkholderia sp.]|jgi:Cu/Ag efflux protein CusF
MIFSTAACAALLVLPASLLAATAAGADVPGAADTAPGALLGTHTFETHGHVVAIDPATNSVTISGERGVRFTFAIEPEIADVSRLAPGDRVDIVYRHAMLLRVDHMDSSGIRSRVETTTTAPAMGGVTSTTHSVEVTATILRINRAGRELTLRGPTGTVVLDVPPNVSLEDLRVGQKVRASYVTQSAVKVTRDGMPVQ